MTNPKPTLQYFFKYLLLFTLFLSLFQYLIVEYFLNKNTFYPTFLVYGFLLLTTFGVYAALIAIHKNFKDKTGFAFMGLSLFKTFLAILFLLPIILDNSDKANILVDVFSFFVPYFLFLLFETFFAVKLLRSS